MRPSDIAGVAAKFRDACRAAGRPQTPLHGRDLDDSHRLMPLLGCLSMIGPPSIAGRDNWQSALAARYPLASSVEFDCFGGWQPILAHFLERLGAAVAQLSADSRRDFHIERITQKFGRLLVRLSKEGTAEMRDAIEEAENASVVTCEVCS